MGINGYPGHQNQFYVLLVSQKVGWTKEKIKRRKRMIRGIDTQDYAKMVVTVKLYDGTTFFGKDFPNIPFGDHDKIFSFWDEDTLIVIPVENVKWVKFYKKEEK